MADATTQTYANHVRLDPPYHFAILPGLGIIFGLAVWELFRNPGLPSLWMLIVSIVLFLIGAKMRMYALKAQDRVIRLEERLRMAALLDDPLRSRILDFDEGQLIALRFASDEELPGLAEKALASKLSGAEIKKAVVRWRADHFRI
jgi:hypothetical protein